MGKGSRPRPFDVDRETYESNWDRIFSKRNAIVGPTKYAIKVGQDLDAETYSTREEAEDVANTLRSSGVGLVEVVEWLE